MKQRTNMIIAVCLVASTAFFRWLAFSLNYGVYQFGVFNWLIPIAQTRENLREVFLVIAVSNGISLVLGIGGLIFFWRYFKARHKEIIWRERIEPMFDIAQKEGQI